MPTIKVTDASAEPITLAEAKAHLRETGSAEDTLITALIAAARQDAEHRMRRTLITTTWRRTLDAFPACDHIDLSFPVLQSVTHLKYYDAAGVQQTWSSSNYLLDVASEPARLALAPNVSWPQAQDRINAVEVQYVAGWANAAAVPEVIKAWIKLRLGTLFEHREQIIAGASVAEVPFVDGLLDPYKVWGG